MWPQCHPLVDKQQEQAEAGSYDDEDLVVLHVRLRKRSGGLEEVCAIESSVETKIVMCLKMGESTTSLNELAVQYGALLFVCRIARLLWLAFPRSLDRMKAREREISILMCKWDVTGPPSIFEFTKKAGNFPAVSHPRNWLMSIRSGLAFLKLWWSRYINLMEMRMLRNYLNFSHQGSLFYGALLANGIKVVR